MTVYISVSTRPAWGQRRMGQITPDTAGPIEAHLRKIAERELQRVRDDHFYVVAYDDTITRVIKITVNRTALFEIESRIT